jgi:S1-C subfamily serine protease
MRKTPLYSRAPTPTRALGDGPAGAPAPRHDGVPPSPDGATALSAAPQPANWRNRWRRISLTDPRSLWAAIGLLSLLLAVTLTLALKPGARALTQEDINAAVLHTLENTARPSPAAKAAATVRGSVVRVMGFRKDPKSGEEVEHGVGTGVVIVDKGVILTNLHVVQEAQTIKVLFADGLEATASITGAQPENDLAVLQAHKIPDDLIAATMRSTQDLAPGDQVVAVGFPFGIGPSFSAGIVSGLKRVFRSPEGKQQLTNLIQFDAAANPGNSGGPLVTMDGEVVGIVTAILNPTSARTFIGIGFAVPIENAAAAVGLHPF